MFITILRDQWRVLTFRKPLGPISSHYVRYLSFGMMMTWLAGVGRYWDNPRATFWQHMGLGSVVYVLVFAFVLWAVLDPLRLKSATYENVLMFVCFTSAPAVLYAIPVELFMTSNGARAANAWFLAVVASWRVALLGIFLRRGIGLSWGAAVVTGLLPLCLTVVTLSLLNLEHVVFEFMGGMGPGQSSSNDKAYGIVVMLSVLSFLAAPFLLIGYFGVIADARKKR